MEWKDLSEDAGCLLETLIDIDFEVHNLLTVNLGGFATITGIRKGAVIRKQIGDGPRALSREEAITVTPELFEEVATYLKAHHEEYSHLFISDDQIVAKLHGYSENMSDEKADFPPAALIPDEAFAYRPAVAPGA